MIMNMKFNQIFISNCIFYTFSPKLWKFQNEMKKKIGADGKVCDPQCADIGCWGPGPTQCAKCQNAIIGDKCIAACDLENGYVVNRRYSICSCDNTLLKPKRH